jgi:hypothetical protein
MQEVIAAMFEQAGFETRDHQMGFCKRQFDLPWPQTMGHADALLEPLKSIALRKVTPDSLKQRVASLLDKKLDAWKTGFVADLDRQIREAEKGGRSAKSVLSTHKLQKLIECEIVEGK